MDSPIVFALLGMDSEARKESYEKLLREMKKFGCELHIFDQNFQEVDGIIARASGWAKSAEYDIRKANNATKFFHDSQMSELDISDYCGSLEIKLNNMGITVISTNYDISEASFQEDEKKLFDMIEKKYSHQGCLLPDEKKKSIYIDIRSIIMIYRKRQGQQATQIQKAKHLLLTSNNAIANISKNYESNQSINAGHIPACVSADLFGAIMWLNTPLDLMDYQKDKLLADCYAFLRPSKALIDKYINSLEDARNADQIDEKLFLFLRSHKVVLDSLMDVTKGDYARFNSKTYIEVYEDIEAKHEKKYKDEAKCHDKTREELQKLEKSFLYEQQQKDKTIEDLSLRLASMEKDNLIQKEQKIKRLGVGLAIFLVFIPCVIILVSIELIKNQHVKIFANEIINLSVFLSIQAFYLPNILNTGTRLMLKLARNIVESNEK